MFKRLIGLLVLVLLTLLTQVGGAVFAICWFVNRFWPAGSFLPRAGINAGLFASLYVVLSVFTVPQLAALGGRVPLPCTAEPDRPFAAAHPAFCWLNRHYVDPRLLTLMTDLSRDVARQFPAR